MVEAKDKSIQWLESIKALKEGPNYGHLKHFDPAIFSRFVYVDVCAPQDAPVEDKRGNSPQRPHEVISYFEPVVGLMRHPLGGIQKCVWEGEKMVNVENRDFLTVLGMTPHEFRAMYPGKAYFFDLGVGNTYYSSLQWFVDEYEFNGVRFDDIYGWEIKNINHSEYWTEHMERRMASRVHLFNMPVRNDTLAVGQAFQIMLSTYKPGDFVSLKLDIDHEELEGRVVEELRANPHLQRMIGEMWFEQHHDEAPMKKKYHWKDGYPYHKALETFHELRSMGIRIHVWP